MNANADLSTVNRATGAALGFILASALFLAFAVTAKRSVNAPPVDADRQAALSQARWEIRTNEAAWLDTAGWLDRSRGLVRLPIQTAMELAARQWQNPEAARSNLMARAEKAAAPAPAAPAKPNPFE
ncbi:MAG TPA: hypothetical protein VFB55_02135 [Verrucomicrobiae bacterium]|nr:hypothetical protein [Verrucomicrobiae bacterium]